MFPQLYSGQPDVPSPRVGITVRVPEVRAIPSLKVKVYCTVLNTGLREHRTEGTQD